MTGVKRLDNVWQLLEDVIARRIPGSFTGQRGGVLQCGVWSLLVTRSQRGSAPGMHGSGVLLAAAWRAAHGLPPNAAVNIAPCH